MIEEAPSVNCSHASNRRHISGKDFLNVFSCSRIMIVHPSCPNHARPIQSVKAVLAINSANSEAVSSCCHPRVVRYYKPYLTALSQSASEPSSVPRSLPLDKTSGTRSVAQSWCNFPSHSDRWHRGKATKSRQRGHDTQIELGWEADDLYQRVPRQPGPRHSGRLRQPKLAGGV